MSPSVPGRSSSPCSWTTSPKRCAASQLERLGRYAEPALCREVEKILPLVHRLTPELRLPLVSMVVPTLRRLSRDQFEAFAAGVRELVRADNQVSLYEYALQRLLFRHLAAHCGYGPNAAESVEIGRSPRRAGAARPGGPGPCGQLRSPRMRPAPLRWGSRPWAGPGSIRLCRRANLDLRKLDHALNELDAAAPPLKRRILAACAGLHRRGRQGHARGGRAAPRHRRFAGVPRPAAPITDEPRSGRCRLDRRIHAPRELNAACNSSLVGSMSLRPSAERGTQASKYRRPHPSHLPTNRRGSSASG